jgi:HIV Tat-specific factor 1
LAVWDSDEEEVLKKSFAPKKNKWAKCVVIYNAFRPIELEEDLDLYNVHKDEMDGVAEILEIKVTKVDIYDLEPRGIIVVRTTDFDDAKKLMNYVNNTKKLYQPYDDPFPKRRLWAEILEDRPKFRKSKEALISDDEDDMPLPQGKVAKDETKAVEDEVKAVKDEVNVTKDDVKVTKDDNDD